MKVLNEFKSVTIERRPAQYVNAQTLAIMAKTEDGADLQLEFKPHWEMDDIVDIASSLLEGGALCWEQTDPLTEQQSTWQEVWHNLSLKTEDDDAERTPNRVRAIKAMRKLTACSLVAAKAAVNAMYDAITNDDIVAPASLGDLINAQLAKGVDTEEEPAYDPKLGVDAHCGDTGCGQCNARWGELVEVKNKPPPTGAPPSGDFQYGSAPGG